MTALPSRPLRLLATALAALFLLSLVPSPVQALGPTPYCPGGSGSVPGATQPAVCEQVTGRVFPEASPLSQDPSCAATTCRAVATDFVGFFEFQAGLDYLAAQYPDWLTVHEVGQSVGYDNPAGGHDTFPVYMLEITNKGSPMPLENRQSMLFMLSIHGVEKGGREGGFRVLEDLVKGVGFAAETVQDGAGMPGGLEKPSGGPVQTYRDYLDFQRIFLLFPNPDGWVHDEAPYVATGGTCGGNGVLFCRTNANGVDLNRQAPTLGWQNENRNPVGEPESIGYYNWMLTQNIAWNYAIDIHGMLNHQNFGAIMMPAGSMTPQEMQRSIRLAETLKERLNGDPHFDNWQTLFASGEQAQSASCQAPDAAGQECFQDGALSSAGSSQFAEYYTVIDAIGYTDSGFNGDYFAQDTGLNAPGYDIELAYNHMAFDSIYPGPGAMMNDFHVKMVREIVKSFMDAAALDVKISFETRGLRTAYVESPFVATNLDDADPAPGGWASENPGDDLWDYGTNGGFRARPAKYWEDLKSFVRNGDQPGVLVRATASQVTGSYLDGFDQLVIPGSAIEPLRNDAEALAAIKAWVEEGGNLVLTDQAMQFLNLTGIVDDGSVDVLYQYMGGIRMDLTKPVFYEYQDASSEENRNVRGGVKQTVEPTPLGFAVGANAVPNWFVTESALTAAGGEDWGLACGTTSLSDPCTGNGVGLGRIPLGSGQVQFIGSLLPDPTEEFYHPYGLDHYATTYSGNQILRNMLYWGNALEAPPIVFGADGSIVQSPNEPVVVPDEPAGESEEGGKESPGLALPLLVAALAAVALLRRRR